MAIQAYAPAAQAVAAGGTILLAQSARRGNSATMSGLGVSLNKPRSTYLVSVSATGTLAAAGDLTVTAQLDGVPVPSATATQAVGAAGDQASVAFTFLAWSGDGCCDRPVITLVNSGDAATIGSACMTVHRLG